MIGSGNNITQVTDDQLLLKPKIADPTFDKLNESYRISEKLIESLDENAIFELTSGYESDLDHLINTINETTYEVVFGGRGGVHTSEFDYLDRLTKRIDEVYCVENLNYFILNKIAGFELNYHHLEWGEYASLYKKICILAARDLGKSFYWSNAYPIWKMYRYKPYNKNDPFPRKDLHLSKRGFLLTNEMDLSQELMEIMQGTIEENPELRDKLMPDKKGEGWSKQKMRNKNGTQFGAKSYGGSFRGRHPGYLVCDDYLRENVIYSPTQRLKSVNYFHATLMNALLKNGQCVVVGTPMHEADIYGDLKVKKAWHYSEYPALFPNGDLLWENRYDFDELMEIREEQGSLMFARERLVRPIVSETSIFPSKILKRAFAGMENYTLVTNIESFPINFTSVVVGVDLAISASASADYSVFSVWGIDERNDMWLLYVYRGRGKSYNTQISQLKAININFAPDLFCIESNQMQAIFGEGAEDSGLPVFLHHTGENKYNFKYGLPSLSVMFERSKIHLPRGDQYSRDVTDLICSEFSSVTWTDKGLEGVGQHDDCVMSTWKGNIASKKLMGVGFALI